MARLPPALQPPASDAPTKQALTPSALYLLLRHHMQGDEMLAQLHKEIDLCERLSHPNVVRVFGSLSRPLSMGGLEVGLLLEYCPGAHSGVPSARRQARVLYALRSRSLGGRLGVWALCGPKRACVLWGAAIWLLLCVMTRV